MSEQRLPCGVKDCGVWFTSEEARATHHALVHDPADVPTPPAPAPEDLPPEPPPKPSKRKAVSLLS